MDANEIKEYREYAWKYFSLHADQRIKTFNFYLILATFATGGMLTVVKDSGPPWAISLIALLLAFLSGVFWQLDCRNKQLVRHGEAALKRLEREAELADEDSRPHVFRIFTREMHETDHLKKTSWINMTYSDCFNSVFALFGTSSLVACLVSAICQIALWTKCPEPKIRVSRPETKTTRQYGPVGDRPLL